MHVTWKQLTYTTRRVENRLLEVLAKCLVFVYTHLEPINDTDQSLVW